MALYYLARREAAQLVTLAQDAQVRAQAHLEHAARLTSLLDRLPPDEPTDADLEAAFAAAHQAAQQPR